MLFKRQAKDTKLFAAGPADQRYQLRQIQCLSPALMRTAARSEDVQMQLLLMLPILVISAHALQCRFQQKSRRALKTW